MSFDFRRGILPSGAYDPQLPNIRGLPYRVFFDHESTDVFASMGGDRYAWVAGNGDPRRPPHDLVSLTLAATLDFDITLSGAGGSYNWTGTVKRGITRSTTGAETGNQVTTRFDAFSLGIYPPATTDASHQNQNGAYIDAVVGALSSSLNFTWIPRNLRYVVADDSWILLWSIGANVSGEDEEEFTSVSSSVDYGEGDASGLTVMGMEWPLHGSGVTSISGTITPASWLT
jgi:hypothetical protein